jgi:hypothetical protein
MVIMVISNDSKKLRIGVFLVLLWWLPFWALATPISEKTGIKISVLTIAIMGVQTVIGVMGFYLCGKTVTKQIKKLPFKKVPGTLWHMLIKGDTEAVDN